jgi:hypothetical protein
MLSLLEVAVVALVLLGASGVAILAWLPEAWQRRLLPGLPAVGAMALVVGLHATTIVVGVQVGLPILAGVAAIALAVRTWRVRRWWRPLLDARWLGVALVLGAIPFLLVLRPAEAYGATLVAPTSGDDAYSFITVSDWLLQHPATDVPSPADAAPVWGYTRIHLTTGLRVGEELDQAAIADADHTNPEQTWYTVSALWLALLPGACAAAAATLGLRREIGLAGGFVASMSGVLAFEVFNANSAGMLGIATVPIALTLFAAYVDRGRTSAPEQRPPLWLAAGAVAALAGSYAEYLPVIGLGMVAFVLVRSPRTLLAPLRAAVFLTIVAAVIAPFVWYDAVRSLVLNTAGASSTQPSAFLGPALTVLAHFTGTRGVGTPQGSLYALPLAGMIALGLVAAMAISPARRLIACVTASIALTVILLSTVRYFPYGQDRAIEISLALVLLFSAIGWTSLLQVLLARWREIAYIAMVGLAGATAAFVYVNVHTTDGWVAAADPQRQVDAAFQQAAGWIESVAGPTGNGAMVISNDHFDQLWLMYATRDLTAVHYPFVYQDYGGVAPLQFDDGTYRRYVVVDDQDFVSAAPGVVVGSDSRFRFLDLSRGSAVIALGAVNYLRPETDPTGPSQWQLNDGEVLVVHSPSVTQVTLTVEALPQVAPEPVTVSIETGASSSFQELPAPLSGPVVIGTSPTSIAFSDPAPVSLVQLDNLRPAASPAPGDPSLLSIRLLGVRGG